MNHVSNDSHPTVSTGPLPASNKTYKPGKQYPDIRVPVREIHLHPTADEEPVMVYDCSGPYTDPDFKTDIGQGLPRLREAWIEARG